MTDQELDRMLDAWEAPSAPARMRARVLRAAPRRRFWRFPVKWAAAACLAAAVTVGAAVMVREPVVGTSWSRLPDGTHIRVKTLVEPKIAILKWFRAGMGGSFGGGSVARYVYDRSARTYSGYELKLEPLGDGRYYASAGPLVVNPARLERWKMVGFSSVAPPPLPAPRIVGLGEAFEVDLVREGGERVYDRIELSAGGFGDEPHNRPLGEGQGGAAMMRLSNPRLFVNGVHFPQEGLAEARGMTVFFGIPGRGEWRLAVDAMGNPEYRAAGRARGPVLEFSWDGESFRIENDQPVVEGGERVLYVRFEPARERGEAGRTASFGASGPAGLK
jgi:hypothetical protein